MITELLSIENKNDRLECIKNIKMSDDEKAKKISKTVAENIIVYLGLNNEDTGTIDK